MEAEKVLELRARHISPRSLVRALIEARVELKTLQVDEARQRVLIGGSEAALTRGQELVRLLDVPPPMLQLDVFRVRYVPERRSARRFVLGSLRLRGVAGQPVEAQMVWEMTRCRLILLPHLNRDGTISLESCFEERSSTEQRNTIGFRRLPRRRVLPIHVLDHRREGEAVSDREHSAWWHRGGPPPFAESIEAVEIGVR